ncbi:MAG: chemotaxis protein [Proteobacteria bacterium]|nr:MAG: chemotaxis protein [Pseudomonadota bacterium]
MFRFLSLKGKIIAFSSFLSLLLMLIGGAGLYSLSSVSTEYEFIANVNLPKSFALASMRVNASQTGRYILRFILPGNSAEDISQIEKKIEEAVAEVDKATETYKGFPITTEQERVAFEKSTVSWLEYKKELAKSIALFRKAIESKETEDQNVFAEYLKDELVVAGTEHTKSLLDLNYIQAERGKIRTENAHALEIRSRYITAFIVIIGVIISILIGLFFSRSLSRAIGSVTEQIDHASTEVRSASEELSAASQTLSAGAVEAASALQETVASIEELNSMVKLTSDSANQASELSEKSSSAAEDGNRKISSLIESMAEISSSSKKIEEIIDVIDDISFQTNLLALNAAVEAARAGEQGRGFAVVAEAVRALAQRSKEAAKEIASLIKDSVIKIDKGAQLAGHGGDALKTIVVSVKKVSELNAAIANASSEQSNGLAQISKAMNELDQATQRNATSSEEVAASSEEMSAQATTMQDLVQDLTLIVSGSGLDSKPDDTQRSSSVKGHIKLHSSSPRVSASFSRYDNALPMDGLNDVKPNIKTTSGF